MFAKLLVDEQVPDVEDTVPGVEAVAHALKLAAVPHAQQTELNTRQVKLSKRILSKLELNQGKGYCFQ